MCDWKQTISIVDYLEEREQTNARSTKIESDSLLMQGRIPEVYNRNFKAWKKRNKRNSSEAEYISNELGKMDEWMNILSSCDDYRRDHISVLQMYKDYLTTRQNYLSQTSDDILIQFIRIGKISPNWQHNTAGRFAYDNVNQCYRFYETD